MDDSIPRARLDHDPNPFDDRFLFNRNADRLITTPVRKAAAGSLFPNRCDQLLASAHGPAVAGRLRETILNERKIIDPARVLELFARPQKVVARPHRRSAADPGPDPDRNRRLRPRAVYLQLVLE